MAPVASPQVDSNGSRTKWNVSSLHELVVSPGSKEEKVGYYADWADAYDREVTDNGYTGPMEVARTMVSALAAIKKQDSEQPDVTTNVVRILDAGCGTGLSGEMLIKAAEEQKYDASFEMVGLDYSPEMLDVAKEKKVYVDVKVADLNEPLQLDGQLFDFIISAGVFLDGHCGPPALVNILDVLAPGGLAVVSVRNESYEDDKDDYSKVISSIGCKVCDNIVKPYFGPVVANYITICKEKV